MVSASLTTGLCDWNLLRKSFQLTVQFSLFNSSLVSMCLNCLSDRRAQKFSRTWRKSRARTVPVLLWSKAENACRRGEDTGWWSHTHTHTNCNTQFSYAMRDYLHLANLLASDHLTACVSHIIDWQLEQHNLQFVTKPVFCVNKVKHTLFLECEVISFRM